VRQLAPLTAVFLSSHSHAQCAHGGHGVREDHQSNEPTAQSTVASRRVLQPRARNCGGPGIQVGLYTTVVSLIDCKIHHHQGSHCCSSPRALPVVGQAINALLCCCCCCFAAAVVACGCCCSGAAAHQRRDVFTPLPGHTAPVLRRCCCVVAVAAAFALGVSEVPRASTHALHTGVAYRRASARRTPALRT
jgi:hypothetical protein